MRRKSNSWHCTSICVFSRAVLVPASCRGIDIRVGRLSDGAVLYRIPDPLELKTTSAAEGVAVDAQGNVYGGEVGPQQLVKHTKIP